jgi:glyoxylate/hydroxypyruvate reductase A
MGSAKIMLTQDNPVMLLKTDARDQEWISAFTAAMPELEVRVWPQVGDLKEINCALLWGPPAELFNGLENLEVIFSIGAGVDSLLACSALPAKVPIVRMVEPELTAGMVEFCLFQVLRFHRLMHCYERQRAQCVWKELPQLPARDTTVGVMGMGVLGLALAKQLQSLNYNVIGYRRQSKPNDAIEMFYGEGQVEAFLRQTMILVMLLPATEQTRQIINRETLAMLPPKACLVNAGRGESVNEQDLLSALDSGQLQAAALDVFSQEPLPAEHPFWSHPGIFLTPHIASITHPPTACRYVADALRAYRAGEAWPNLVETGSGY